MNMLKLNRLIVNPAKVWANSPYKNSTDILNRYVEEYEILTEPYNHTVIYLSQVDYKTKYYALTSPSGRIKEGDRIYKNVRHWLENVKKRPLPNYVFD